MRAAVRFGIRVLVVLGWIMAGMAPASAQAPIWESRWVTDVPLSPSWSLATSFGSSGGVLAEARGEDATLALFDPDGQLRSVMSLAPVGAYGRIFTIAVDDGGALITDDYGPILRVLADGSVAWTSNTYPPHSFSGRVQALLRAGNDHVVVVQCIQRYPLSLPEVTLTSRRISDGVERWRRRDFIAAVRCEDIGAAADAAGAIYVGGEGPITASGSAIERMKFDVDGQRVWITSSTIPNAAHPFSAASMVAGRDNVFMSVKNGLLAFRNTDGAAAWNVSGEYGIGYAGNKLIARTATGILVSHAESDGSLLWAIAAGSIEDVHVNDQGVLFLADGVLKRLSLHTGASEWTASVGTGTQEVGFLGVSTIITVAQECPMFSVCTRQVATLNALNGHVLIAQHAINASTGMSQMTWTEDGSTHRIEAGVYGSRLFARRIELATGNVAWQKTFESYFPAYYPIVAMRDDRLIVGAQLRTDLWFARIDPSNGNLLWEKLMQGNGQSSIQGSSVALTSDGLYISGVRRTWPTDPESAVISVMKLDASNGNEIWHVDGRVVKGPTNQESAPEIRAIGSDIIVQCTQLFPAAGGWRLLRLSGSDGQVLWSKDSCGGLLPDTGDGLITSAGVSTSGMGFTKIAPLDGTTIWSTWHPFSLPPTASIESYDFEAAFSGDIVLGGRVRESPSSRYRPWLASERSDGSGLKFLRTYPLPGDWINRASVTHIAPRADGQLWVRLSVLGPKLGHGFLARLNPDTGDVLGMQSLGEYAYDPLFASHSLFLEKGGSGNRMLASGYSTAPGQPAAHTLSLRDMNISAHGDLSTQTSVSNDHPNDGESLGYEATVAYTGDAALAEATAIVDLPGDVKSATATCDASGVASCQIDTRGIALRVVLSGVQPGANVRVHGVVTANVVEGSGYRLSSMVFGPMSLQEMDVANNFHGVLMTTSLFADGFDRAH